MLTRNPSSPLLERRLTRNPSGACLERRLTRNPSSPLLERRFTRNPSGACLERRLTRNPSGARLERMFSNFRLGGPLPALPANAPVTLDEKHCPPFLLYDYSPRRLLSSGPCETPFKRRYLLGQ